MPDAGDLDRVGVGAGAAAAGLDRVLDALPPRRSRRAARRPCGERVEPRPITGPEPSGWLPSSFSSTPGASVAWVTSTAIAMSGRTAKAEVRAPNRPISSWTAATAAN